MTSVIWKRIAARLLCGFLCSFVPACGLFGEGKMPSAMERQEQDIAQYNQLEQQLVANRRDFLSKRYSYPTAVENSLYFLDFPGFDPFLHRYDKTNDRRIDYSFSIGPGDAFNYRASDTLVVTATESGSAVLYSAYAAGQASSLVGSTTFPKPVGAKWSAYAVTGGTVYIVTQDTMGTWLHRWIPGSPSTQLFKLETATAQPQLGIFIDFGVDGNNMLFIEGGRLWKLDINAARATWLRNMSAVGDTVNFDASGVLFSTRDGLLFVDAATLEEKNLSHLIEENPYKLNETYAQMHYYAGGFTRWNKQVLYGGMNGLFAYDLSTNTIKPVLLEPRSTPQGDPLRYAYPQVVTSGFLYITGLQGADGAIYEVDLKKVLQ